MARNPYLPHPARIEQVIVENEARDIKSFRLAFEEPESAAQFRHLPGQFAELSLPGMGEAPFGIASAPTESDRLLFSIKKVGLFTGELHSLEPGAAVGVRGPLGRPFPWERMAGGCPGPPRSTSRRCPPGRWRRRRSSSCDRR